MKSELYIQLFHVKFHKSYATYRIVSFESRVRDYLVQDIIKINVYTEIFHPVHVVSESLSSTTTIMIYYLRFSPSGG